MTAKIRTSPDLSRLSTLDKSLGKFSGDNISTVQSHGCSGIFL